MTSPPEAREIMVLLSTMAGPEIERLVSLTETVVLPRGTKVLDAIARAKLEVDDGGGVRLSNFDMELDAPDPAEYCVGIEIECAR